MHEPSLKKLARYLATIGVPIVCGTVLSACATDEYVSVHSAVASPASASVVTPASYHAVRASELIGRPVRNIRGDYLGQVSDLVLDMNSGDVRYIAVSNVPAGSAMTRVYIVPMRSFASRAGNDVTLDITATELARYRSWLSNDWPRMRDTAYWNEIDRLHGFTSAGMMYDRWSELAGRTVYDATGHHLGQVRDLVVNMNTAAVHYAVVSFEPGVAAADHFYAVPLYAFLPPRDRANRLVLNMDRSRIAQLESFDAARWTHINDPAYVARIDRYFVTTFPRNAATFDQLDTNHDGFLSKAELAPLGLTTDASGHRVIRITRNTSSALFHRLDADHDGFLTRLEAAPTLSAATFDRLDTNRDGFLSIGEATPELASLATSDRHVVTFDALDRDRDGFLTKTEAAPLFGGTTIVTVPRSSAPAVVSFDSVDRNRDGFISRTEARAALRSNASLFDRYDSNHDGFLSRAEADPLLRSGVGGSSGEVVERTIVVPR